MCAQHWSLTEILFEGLLLLVGDDAVFDPRSISRAHGFSITPPGQTNVKSLVKNKISFFSIELTMNLFVFLII